MATLRLFDGRLKLRHLVLVDALTEHGTVVGAARYLHIAQPAATRSLRELEDLLGVELYERGPRGLTPTVFGRAFTRHARAVLAQLSEAGRHLGELSTADRGTVTVGCHLAGSNLLVPRAIERLKAVHPRVTVVVREATPELLAAELEAGRLDLVVGRIGAPAALSHATHEPLYEERIAIVCRAGHPATRLAAPGLADLVDHPWILPGTETVLRAELETAFLRQNLPLPENQVVTTSILTVRHLLSRTDTVAALPSLIAVDDPVLVTLPLTLDRIGTTVGLTVPATGSRAPSTDALIDALRAVGAELRAAGDGGPQGDGAGLTGR